MRIRIGNQTAFSSPPMIPFEYAADRGFDAFEWLPDKKESGEGWSESEISTETRKFIRDTALTHDIRQSVHAPWPSNPLEPAAGGLFAETVQFARDIAASLINIHFFSGNGIEAYAGAVIPFAKRLAEAGIMLSIENTPDSGPESFNELFLHFYEADPQGAANIGMCLDIGHANLHSSTRNDYLGYMDRLHPRVPIIHIHMHENYGDSDSHLTIFTGPSKNNSLGVLGVIDRLKKRNFSGSIILEEWPKPESLLLDARNRLLDMIAENKEVPPGAASGPVDLAARIIEADGRLPNWKKKLEWIEKLLTQDLPAPEPADLASIALYLRFIARGEIGCREDGDHYRPSHHARISRRIYNRLAKITSPENVLIVRRIYPWIPSFADAYMRAEPLTLIRDIAHRNDIPKELKQEIKRTLQNKLHRSAGPEDLATSASLLTRITEHASDYPKGFVEEFKRFHEELKDFFNAYTLKEMLERILQERTVPEKEILTEFLDSTEKATDTLKTLQLLTLLRTKFSETLRNAACAEAQRLRTADLRLEDFSFVLLSRLINAIDVAKDQIGWEESLQCLSLAVENVRLGGLSEEECLAIESELRTWVIGFASADHTQLMRLRATLDRCRRLAEGYCADILTLFPERVDRMGRALGVSQQAIKFFAETEIRRHPVFQLARLVSSLMRPVRASAGLPPWDTIVPGRVSGRLVIAPSLWSIPDTFDEPIIAVVEKVEGDEEIPVSVDGIIIPHETPLLSHLAVRLRQKGACFAVCEDPELFAALKNSVGEKLTINASAESVNIAPALKTEEIGVRVKRNLKGNAEIPEVSFSLAGRKLVGLEEITLSAAGGKALAARRLQEISRIEGAGFTAPKGIVIPFGVMEEALRSSPSPEDYFEIVGRLDRLPRRDFDDMLQKLKGIVHKGKVPDAIVAGVVQKFGMSTPLMVRSSANCEDTPGISGAGFYDSVPNVRPAHVATAVAAVWSSLWDTVAAAGMRGAGVRLEKIHMAVLIQAMIIPDFSFIMHTVNPLNCHRDEIYIELAVGMGETLASGRAQGIPYRIVYDKGSDKGRTLAFASFSDAAWPGDKGGLIRKTVDYSEITLSRDETLCTALGIRLGRTAHLVENIYGYPLDLEGLVSGDAIYLVQARHQQGIMRT